MKFRPCIDIHNGKVKQIVGGSLLDQENQAQENFVSEQNAAFYAECYRKKGIRGGHIILLNPPSSEYFQATRKQALEALGAYPGGMQIGGGITHENAGDYIEKGASHVIVTSFVFKNGRVNWDNLEKLVKAVGKERIVLDLSCRKRNGKYYVVTDRWQKFTEETLDETTLERFQKYCDEFLVHAVDVEGKASGVEKELAEILGSYGKLPVTYAGGIGSYDDIEILKKLGRNKLDITIGSALDLFGGTLEFEKVLSLMD